MKTVKCRYCNTNVQLGTKHQCLKMQQARLSAQTASEDNGDFFVSLAIAAATNNWSTGAAMGGNPIGGIVGDLLVDDNPARDNDRSDTYSSSSNGND